MYACECSCLRGTEALDPLKLELQAIMSCHVGARNLCKGGKRCQLLSRLAGSYVMLHSFNFHQMMLLIL